MEQVKVMQGAGFARVGAIPRPGQQTAPDLARYRRQAGGYRETAPEVAAQPVAVPRPRVDRHARRMRLSLSGALMFIVAFSSVMFIVYTYMQLSEMSAETAKLQKTLTAIKKENAGMLAQMDKQLDLAQLEQAAIEMGMVLPDKETIVYLDLSGEDHAVVLEKPGLWDSLMNAFASMSAKVHEYFS